MAQSVKAITGCPNVTGLSELVQPHQPATGWSLNSLTSDEAVAVDKLEHVCKAQQTMTQQL